MPTLRRTWVCSEEFFRRNVEDLPEDLVLSELFRQAILDWRRENGMPVGGRASDAA